MEPDICNTYNRPDVTDMAARPVAQADGRQGGYDVARPHPDGGSLRRQPAGSRAAPMCAGEGGAIVRGMDITPELIGITGFGLAIVAFLWRLSRDVRSLERNMRTLGERVARIEGILSAQSEIVALLRDTLTGCPARQAAD